MTLEHLLAHSPVRFLINSSISSKPFMHVAQSINGHAVSVIAAINAAVAAAGSLLAPELEADVQTNEPSLSQVHVMWLSLHPAQLENVQLLRVEQTVEAALQVANPMPPPHDASGISSQVFVRHFPLLNPLVAALASQ
jgi:hypothetical protein